MTDTFRRPFLLCWMLLPGAMGLPAQQRATIVIQVRSSLDQAPLSDARITLSRPAGGDTSAVTDSSGRFVFRRLHPGSYTLRATWRELVSHPAVIELGSRETVDVEFAVGPRPEMGIQLPEIAVEARPAPRPLLQGFDERRSRGVGQFLTRADLGAKRGSTLGEVLRQQRGIRLHCSRGVCIPQMIRARVGCFPRFIMDDADIDGQIFARTVVDDVEAVEIYEGVSQMSLDFGGDARRNYCGAIVVWTRRPGLAVPPPSSR
ncbi:MAG TPA: carboxypeptidase-like regulatory domain-containing protein [Gemmatimonadales bacterium]|nr:carboxypeptidase-like regulatory domain-containing protein [Gemmatimonadales bacterium]